MWILVKIHAFQTPVTMVEHAYHKMGIFCVNVLCSMEDCFALIQCALHIIIMKVMGNVCLVHAALLAVLACVMAHHSVSASKTFLFTVLVMEVSNANFATVIHLDQNIHFAM
jgi:hypothetical protein